MHKGSALIALLWASCSFLTENNPDYCVDDTQCTAPAVCSLPKHSCEVPVARPDDPAITSVSPAAAARDVEIEVTIKGRNLLNVTQVLFAGKAGKNLRVESDSQLKIIAPPGPGLCGLTTVTLKTSDQRSVSDSKHFRYRASNVQLSVAAGGSVTSLGARSPASLISYRVNATDLDDLLMGELAPGRQFAYIEVGGTASQKSIIAMYGGPTNAIEFKKLIHVNALPGSLPTLLAGNLVDRVVSFPSTLNGPPSYTVASDPEQPVVPPYVDFDVADIDKDNKVELLVLQSGPASTSIKTYRASAGGSYTTSTTGPALSVGESSHMGIVDLNGDKYPDIVLTNKTSGGISVLMNDKAGGFSNVDFYTTGSINNNLIIADMDLDGLMDIVVFGMATTTNPALSVFYNTTVGGFDIINHDTVVGSANQALVADFDCDELPDLIVYDGTRLRFFANTGRGTQLGRPVELGDINLTAMTAGQFTNDRQNDLALVQSSCSEIIGGLACLRFLANGSN